MLPIIGIAGLSLLALYKSLSEEQKKEIKEKLSIKKENNIEQEDVFLSRLEYQRLMIENFAKAFKSEICLKNFFSEKEIDLLVELKSSKNLELCLENKELILKYNYLSSFYKDRFRADLAEATINKKEETSKEGSFFKKIDLKNLNYTKDSEEEIKEILPEINKPKSIADVVNALRNKMKEDSNFLKIKFLSQEEIDGLLDYADKKDEAESNNIMPTQKEINELIDRSLKASEKEKIPTVEENLAKVEELLNKNKVIEEIDLSKLTNPFIKLNESIEKKAEELKLMDKIKKLQKINLKDLTPADIEGLSLENILEGFLFPNDEALNKVREQANKDADKIIAEMEKDDLDKEIEEFIENRDKKISELETERRGYQQDLARCHELEMLNSKLSSAGGLSNLDLRLNGKSIPETMKELESKLNDCTLKINKLR